MEREQGEMEKTLSTIKPRVGRAAPRHVEEMSLVDLPLDVEALVVRIDTSSDDRIHRLASLGILPGAKLRLVQNRGAFLALIDRYQIAIDHAVARAVWVVESRQSTVDSRQ